MRIHRSNAFRIVILMGCLSCISCGDSGSSGNGETGFLTLTQVSGPSDLNSTGRGLFANVLLDGETVILTYQIAGESLTDGKDLYYRKYDRELNESVGETRAIQVTDHPVFKGDLGDHKLLLVEDRIYMVAMLSWSPYAVLLEFDTAFQQLSEPVYIGNPATDVFTDMGFATDGEYLYVQSFYQTANSKPEDWAAHIYRYDLSLELVDSTIAHPESGSFVTGTSLVFLPAGGGTTGQDRLQIFSTNRDFGNEERIGIHTFAIRKDDLGVIAGSTQTIIEEDLDAYFPTGPSWSEKHQIWFVGFTVESEDGDIQTKEVGPSFVNVFDSEWRLLQQVRLNNGDPAMRVMTQTIGDDLYVVYDEMDKTGQTPSSKAKSEHFRIE